MTTYTGVVKTYYDKEEIKLKEEYFLVNGKKEGIKKLYYIGEGNINGKLSSIVNYINNYMDGEFKAYYSNGMIEMIANYNNGIMIGEYKTYYKIESEYDEFQSEQNESLKYYCKDVNAKNREEIEYYNSGKIKKICKYVNDKLKKITEYKED